LKYTKVYKEYTYYCIVHEIVNSKWRNHWFQSNSYICLFIYVCV